MITFRRSSIAATMAMAVSLFGGSAAFAGGAATETFREVFHEVHEESPTESYVFDTVTVFHVTTRPDGVTSGSVNAQVVQTHLVNGVVADVITGTSHQHAVFAGEEEPTLVHTGGHSRYEGNGQTCQTSVAWHLVGGRVVIEKTESVCR